MTTDLRKRIEKKISEIASVAASIPGVIVIHDLPDFSVQYMSPWGLELLGVTANEIVGMSSLEYFQRFFNDDESEDQSPKILSLIERNTDETISFFQQVRTSKTHVWDWYMSSIKILMRDEGRPVLTIVTAMKIDSQDYFTAKASRLLEENIFLRNHYQEFAQLTSREKEILKLLVLGKNAGEAAAELSISTATVETHRKNIRQKLKAPNSYELSQYARAFNLI